MSAVLGRYLQTQGSRKVRQQVEGSFKMPCSIGTWLRKPSNSTVECSAALDNTGSIGNCKQEKGKKMLDTTIHMVSLEFVNGLPVMELANEYPLLIDDQETDLIASVEANGVREPLILFEDQLADGRNRLASANKVGLDKVPVRYFIGTIEEAEDLIIDLNEKRRHLLPVQRAYIADKHRAIVVKRSEERKNASIPKEGQKGFQASVPDGPSGTLERGETREILARKHNAGINSIDT